MSERAESRTPGATSTATERKRRQRARDKELYYSREDWRLFLDPTTLPQKAGCQPDELRKVVLKELVDNQLDATGQAQLKWLPKDKAWIVSGSGQGPSLSAIPKLFCVNRPLVSSKLKRIVSRGLLGNGLRVVMGAVYALGGSIAVTLRGRRLSLALDPADGTTKIVNDQVASTVANGGMSVRISLGQDSGPKDEIFAREAIDAADKLALYSGPSSPWWYGERDLQMLFSAAPANASVSDVLADLGFDFNDPRLAKTLDREDIERLLAWLCGANKPVPPQNLGRFGQCAFDYAGYGIRLDEMMTPAGAHVPYVVEAWADAEKLPKKGVSEATVVLLVNATRAVAPLHGMTGVAGVRLSGCGISRWVELKTARYRVLLSIMIPYIQLAGDGKEPVLAPLGRAIEEALKRACNAAYRLMDKPAGAMSVKEAAYEVMEEAYRLTSGEGQYPANARQIMYQARPKILKLTGRLKFDDNYFTQKLLPDFQEDNPELTADWKVSYDARGHFIEPHTYYEIGIGTIEVRDYLSSKAEQGPAVSLSGSQMYLTRGPLNRYYTILFIEKEGFMPLLESARIAERFDLAIMSTKGMSVTAARQLLDKLSADLYLEKVLVLHDFDAYGFSIFGTLFTDTRRYRFSNQVPVVDIGFRLEDVQGIEPEPYEVPDWDARVETLRRHGATQEEIEFLQHRRVELNAMTAPEFVEFLERKLAIHARKVVPSPVVVEEHARRIWEQLQAAERCKEILEAIHAEAPRATLPPDLIARIKIRLSEEPTLSWDQALARILESAC